MSTPRQQIAAIDKLINANHAEVKRRARADLLTAHDWQQAWDRWPELWARDQEFYRQRGVAQLERDQQEHSAYRREQRAARAKYRAAPLKQCKHCGSYTRAAA